MKVSIITVVKNNVSTIAKTIESVFSQNYSDIEYIVIDGGSTDGTVEILKKYQQKISYFVSEADGGIYDALNKGIAQATGDVVGVLHGDDFLYNQNVISRVVESFGRTRTDAVYADILICNRLTQRIVRRWKSGKYKKIKLYFGWIPPHPTLYVKRAVLSHMDKGYRTELSIAADYEYMLRLFLEGKKFTYLNEYLVVMRNGGMSARNIVYRLRGLLQVYSAWLINGKMPPPLLFWRVIRKIPQWFVFNEKI